MQRRWVRAGLITVLISAALWGAWQTGLATRVYRRLVPRPLTEEIPTGQVRGINGAGLGEVSPNGFDFIVAGHIYGGHNESDHQPDGALLSYIPAIIRTKPAFFVSLGDMVQFSESQDFDILDQSLLDLFPFPVFNTVGNHDVDDRALYESRYGKTYYTFKYGPARLVFLDTEEKKCDLTPAQIQMLTGAVQNALNDGSVRYVFIFMHKTLFFRNEELAAQKMSLAGPNEWGCYQNPFVDLVDRLLLPASAEKPIYLFAGDVGVAGNLTPYYERNPESALTMLMTGLGDTSQDNMIHVHVDDNQVTLGAIFLRDMSSQLITEFDSEYWERVAAGEIKLFP